MESVVVRKTIIKEQGHLTASAWSSIGNLIAIAVSSVARFARVLILELDSIQEYIVLEVPLNSESDFVQHLDFSPVRCPLTLITATLEGNVYLWTPREESDGFQPFAANTWSSERVLLGCTGNLVYCKFLNPAPAYRWPPKSGATTENSTSPIVPLEHRFLHQDPMVSNELTWLRAGLLYFIAIDSRGDFQVVWKSIDQWIVCGLHSLLPENDERIVVADVISGIGCSLRVALVIANKPSEITLLTIKGHPSSSEDLEDSFLVHMEGMSPCEVDRPVCYLKFQQYSLGKVLIALQRTSERVVITKHAFTSSSFSEIDRAVFKTPLLEEELLKYVSMQLSVDGSNFVLSIPKVEPAVVSVGTLKIAMKLKSNPVDFSSAVYSPNGVCLGVIERNAKQNYVFQIWTLPEAPINCAASKHQKSVCMWDSVRINWSMVNRTDAWDVCQRIIENIKVLSESDAYGSLLLLDSDLHLHPYHSRPPYSDLLDKIKIRILQNTEDICLRTVLMDLYSRRMVSMLYDAYMAIFGSSPKEGLQNFAANDWTPAEKHSFLRWINWTEEFFRFFCQCLKTWTVRYSSDLSAEEAPHVPFIRLLGDVKFTKHVSMLLFACPQIGKQLISSSTDENTERFKRLHDYCTKTISHFHNTVKKRNLMGPSSDPHSPANVDSYLETVHRIRETLPGPVYLNYSRLSGPLTPEVLIDMSEEKVVEESQSLSNAEIQATALKLGLLPDKAIAGFLVCQANEKTLLLKTEATRLKLPIFDCLKGKHCVDTSRIFYASDHSCMAVFRSNNPDDNDEIGGLDEVLQKHASAKSPFTGSMWKQLYDK